MSLSAWCVTAAHLIVCGARVPSAMAHGSDFLSIDTINADPRVHVESLDARDAWPPLLRPGVLAGHEVYDAWETRVLGDFIGAVAVAGASLPLMLASALCWTDVLRAWSAKDGALHVRLQRPWRHPDAHRLLGRPADVATLRGAVLDPLMRRVPAQWRASAWPEGLTDPSADATPLSRSDAEAALARYLGTRLIGSWVGYQGEGLRSVAASLVSAYVLVAIALATGDRDPPTIGRMTTSIRAADWLLLHLLDRPDWAAWCAAWEGDADATRLLGLVAGAAALMEGLPWSNPGPV